MCHLSVSKISFVITVIFVFTPGQIQYGKTHGTSLIGRSAEGESSPDYLTGTIRTSFCTLLVQPPAHLSKLSYREAENRYICHALFALPLEHRAPIFLSTPDATTCLNARYFCRMITLARCLSTIAHLNAHESRWLILSSPSGSSF